VLIYEFLIIFAINVVFCTSIIIISWQQDQQDMLLICQLRSVKSRPQKTSFLYPRRGTKKTKDSGNELVFSLGRQNCIFFQFCSFLQLLLQCFFL